MITRDYTPRSYDAASSSGSLCLWAVVGLPALGSCADATALQGLPGFLVITELIPPTAARFGLTGRQLQEEVESQLRQAGIAVLPFEHATEIPGAPVVHVAVVLLQDNPALYVFGITVEVNQQPCWSITAPILSRVTSPRGTRTRWAR